MAVIDRTNYDALVDDDGTNTTGTVWDKAHVSSVTLDPVDTVVNALYVICQGRLTLQSGTAIATSDQTAKTTLYFTPYLGARIALYTGSQWKMYSFSETSLALGTLVNAHAYDVFAYDSSGTVTLEALEWANATITVTIASPGVVTWTAHGMSTGNSITFTTTGALPTGLTANTQYWITVVDANSFKLSTSPANVSAGTFINTSGTQSGTHTGHQPQARATALTTQDGIFVKSGATTRRYLGTFLTTATTTTEDSFAKRYVWNYYNRIRRVVRVTETTDSWTYSTTAFRQANAAAANQVEMVIGVAESELDLQVIGQCSHSTGTFQASVAIGEDSTTTPTTGGLMGVAYTDGSARIVQSQAALKKYPTVGRHFYAWLEWGGGTVTQTWYGDGGVSFIQSGVHGSIEG